MLGCFGGVQPVLLIIVRFVFVEDTRIVNFRMILTDCSILAAVPLRVLCELRPFTVTNDVVLLVPLPLGVG